MNKSIANCYYVETDKPICVDLVKTSPATVKKNNQH